MIAHERIGFARAGLLAIALAGMTAPAQAGTITRQGVSFSDELGGRASETASERTVEQIQHVGAHVSLPT